MDSTPDESKTPFEKVFKDIEGIATAKLTPDNTVMLEVRAGFEWNKQGKKILGKLETLERGIGYVSLSIKRIKN